MHRSLAQQSSRHGDGPVQNGAPISDLRRNVAVYTAAYFIDVAGLLGDNVRRRIDELDETTGVEWPRTVAELYSVNRDFASKLYAALREHFSARQALAFIVRGFDVPNAERLVETLLALGNSPEALVEERIGIDDCLEGRR